MAKYDPLRTFLETRREPIVKLSFSDIERILGSAPPKSARHYPAWWSNERSGTHAHAESWMGAGFHTRQLDLNARTVEFVRSGAASDGRQ